MKLEYCSATLSPYYPTLKPFVTHNRAIHTQPTTEQYIPTNQTSQSRYLPLILPLNLAICLSISLSSSTQILSFSLSISRSASFSVAVSLSISLSRAVAHALSLPLTRYVSLSLHVQLLGIFVCKVVIFMHTLILGFDQFS